MDRFRVQALEKIVRSGTLSAADHGATLGMLLEKTAGAIKDTLLCYCRFVPLVKEQP